MNLVVVDNASRPEVRRFLQDQPGVKIFLDHNLGLYKALNLGMRLIDQEFVAFLDCDIVVTPGWWQALATEVSKDPVYGLAGSRYLNPDGTLQEGFPVLSRNGWYGENSEDRRESADCQYIAIGCSVFRRSAWQAVGGFDENYFISHGDIDFCYRIRYKANMRVRYCPGSAVIHDHEYGKEQHYEKIRFDHATCNNDHERFRTLWQESYSHEPLPVRNS
jgi:GT2 family glycosyltransferase